MTGWVASLKHDEVSNWDICKQAQLFGTGSTRAAGVRAGDTLFVWWSQHGLIARAQVVQDSRAVTSPDEVPWPNPNRYKYIFRIEVTHDLDDHLDIRWGELNVIAEMGGVPASQFPPVHAENVLKIDMLFGETSEEAWDPNDRHRGSRATTTYRRAGVSTSSTHRLPFEVDPDKVDRGLNGHRKTQDALADWLSAQGIEPLSPTGVPTFDLAWRVGGELFVGEVKSLMPENEVHQIRLAIGQVLEYGHRLDATPVVILERKPTDEMWLDLTRRLDIWLVWPDSFDSLRI